MWVFASVSKKRARLRSTWLGQQWQARGTGALPSNLPFVDVSTPSLSLLFVLTKNSVFVSHDLGNTWATANVRDAMAKLESNIPAPKFVQGTFGTLNERATPQSDAIQ